MSQISSQWSDNYTIYCLMTPREELKRYESFILDIVYIFITQVQKIFLPISCFIPVYLFFSVKNLSGHHVFLIIWSLLEIALFLYSYYKIPLFDSITKDRELVPDNPVAFANKMIEYEPQIYQVLKKWTKRTDAKVSKEHLRYWISWFFFFKDVNDLNSNESSQRAEIENMLAEKIVKDSQGDDKNLLLELKDSNDLTIFGSNLCFRPSLDPVPYDARPLLFYGICSLLNFITNQFLFIQGFHMQTTNQQIKYFYYEPEIFEKNNEEPPIVFIHGVGLELLLYITLVLNLKNRYPKRRLILLTLPYISCNIFSFIPTKEQTLNAIDGIFRTHNIDKCSIFGHSYGSVVASWLIRKRSQKISQVMLVDPLTIRIWDPSFPSFTSQNNANNFAYKLFQWYLREPILAHSIHRNLQWVQNHLLPEHFEKLSPGTKIHIYYSEFDVMIDAPGCYQYLQSQCISDLSVKIIPFSHGFFINNKQYTEEIIGKL